MKHSGEIFSDYNIRCYPYTRRITKEDGVRHSHTFWEISYLIYGRCINQFDGKAISMEFTDVAIMRPNDTHQYKFETNQYDYRDLYVSDTLMRSVCDLISPSLYFMLINKKEPISFKLDTVHMSSIEKSATHFDGLTKRDFETDSFYQRLIYRILSLYIDENQNSPGHSLLPRNFADVLRDIEQDPTNVNYDEIIDRIGYSRSHANRMFIKYTGMPLREFLIEAKLIYATVLLTNKEYKIVDIAYMLGYSSQSSFIKAFKKRHKCLPSEYRKSRREKNSFSIDLL